MAKAPAPTGPMVAAARALEVVDWAELLAVLSAGVVAAWLAAEVVAAVVAAVEASAKLLISAMVGGFWVAQSFWMLLLH